MIRELRQGLRALGRNRLASAVIVVTLGVSLGVVCAVFGVLDAAVLRPLPFPEPDRLVAIWSSRLQQPGHQGRVSMADFLDWRETSRSFDGMAVIQDSGLALWADGAPEEIVTSLVSPDLFRLLGVKPAHGRTLLPEEEVPGRDRVVVLANGLWRRRFGADPGVVGRTLVLDGQEHVVVGVMPAGFQFPSPEIELWTPLALDLSQRDRLLRGRRIMRVVARLADGVGLRQAADEMAAVAAGLAERHPATNAGWGVLLVPLHEQIAGNVGPVLLLLLAASAAVLLIAAANIATLLLARAAARRQELAVRAALGARVLAVFRLLSAEALLLVAAGTGLGLLLAHAALRLLAASGLDVPRLGSVQIDARLLLFALALAAATFLLIAGPLALRGGWVSPADALRGGGVAGGPGAGRQRVIGSLVAVEVALALGLLAGAGLLVRSLLRLADENPGFETRRILAAQVRLPAARYGAPQQTVDFYDRLLASLAAHPSVRVAAVTSALPMSPVGVEFNLPFEVESRPRDSGENQEQVQVRAVSPEYFRALGIPLLRGRGLTAGDRPSAPLVALVNHAFAQRAWPESEAEAVGQRVSMPLRGWRSYEIVGVVGDVRHQGLEREPQPEIYLPVAQAPLRNMAVVVRTAGDPLSLAGALTAAVRDIDREQPITAMTTMEEVLRATASPRRLTTFLVVLFAVAAWLLAGIGIFGMAAFATGQRMSDFAVCRALGAPRAAILRSAVAPALIWIVAGSACGLLVAFAAARVLERFLYSVSPFDPVALLVAVTLLAAVALAGCLLPARRALRVDPAVVLRCE